MRKIVIMGALVLLVVGVFASAAYARTFTCTDLPCNGTSGPDVINERPAFGVPDEIFARAGADNVNAAISPGDVDILHGQRGADTLDTYEQFPESDSLDTVYGGRGTDTCRVNDGDEYHSCEVLYIDGVLQP
jgi:hypothetical protein